MVLDLSSLVSALSSLERALTRSQANTKDEELRDAVIQRFEYSFELCWKMLKRKLAIDALVPTQIDTMSFKELIREACQRGLISEPEDWFEYRSQRNITAHTYNRAKAESVYLTARDFLPKAKKLLQLLQK